MSGHDDERARLRHDLRTPLAVILGFADLLASEQPVDDEIRRDYARRISGAALEMRELLDAAAR